MQLSSEEQIRTFAQANGTRQAIVPAVLHLMQQGQSPTGHAVYKLLGQGSQTTINDQIKRAYQELGALIAPIMATQTDDGASSSVPVLFKAFLELFNQATESASSRWLQERDVLKQQLRELQASLDRALASHHAELDSCDRKIETLKDAVTAKDKELASATMLKDEANDRAKIIEADLALAGHQIATLEVALTETGKSHQSQTLHLREIHANELSSMEQRLAARRDAELAELDSQHKASFNSLNQTLAVTTEQLQAAKQRISDLVGQGEEMKHRATVLEEQAQLLRERNSTLDRQLAISAASLDQSSRTLMTLKEANTNLSRKNELLQSTNNEHERLITGLKATNEALNTLVEKFTVSTRNGTSSETA